MRALQPAPATGTHNNAHARIMSYPYGGSAGGGGGGYASGRLRPKTLAEYYELTHANASEASAPSSDPARHPLPGDASDGISASLGSASAAGGVAAALEEGDKGKLGLLVGHDTAAGKLLTALYGRPKVSVPIPKPKTATWVAPDKWERPMQAGVGAEDPRMLTVDKEAMRTFEENRRRQAEEEAAAAAAKMRKVAAIDSHKGMRKTAAQIAAETAAAQAAGDKVQPPLRRGYNPEVEKTKLQTLFALKGGKALPEAGLAEVYEGQIPMHLLTGKRAPTVGAGGRADAPATAADVAAAHGLSAESGTLLAAADRDELQLLAECAATRRTLLEAITERRAHMTRMQELRSWTAEQTRELETDVISEQAEIRRIDELVSRVQRQIMGRVSSSAAS